MARAMVLERLKTKSPVSPFAKWRPQILASLCATISLSCGRSSLSLSDERRSSDVPRVAAGGQIGVGGSAGQTNGGGMSAGGTSAVPQECGARIDDMEDASGRICSGSGRLGSWYVFHDDTQGAAQWPAETSPGTPIEMSLIPGGRGTSRVGVHSYGGDFVKWGGGIGFDLNFDGATYRRYDASRYRGVHFWARSNSIDSPLRFRVNTESTTDVKYGGTCDRPGNEDCAGPHGVDLKLEPEWLDYTVTFAELGVANEQDRLTNVQFMTNGTFDFWIDDVSFVEGVPNCCSNLPACQGGVHFSDAGLREQVASTSDRPGEVLGCDVVCVLRQLSVTGGLVQSLDGLECLGALEDLRLDGTNVTDVTPLSRLGRLHGLSITGGVLSNIAPLGALVALRHLSLDGNQIADARPLASLVQLQSLSLGKNALVDVAPLASLTSLTTLVLAGNRIQHPSPLSPLSALLKLDLSQNQIVNLGEPLALPVLDELNLDDNQLVDVRALTSLGRLRTLHLNRNGAQDASPLAALGRLEVLELSGNQVTSTVGALSGLAQLRTLDLSHNQVAAVGTVSGLPTLQYLMLENNQLSNVDGLAPLTQLVSLDLSNNAIHTLNGPFSFNDLWVLNLSNNGLLAITANALAGTNVRTAILSENQLQDLSAFAQVTFRMQPCDRCDASARLDLSDNPVRDLTPLLLAQWPPGSFGELFVTDGALDCAAQASNVQALRARGVTVTGCP